MIDHGETTVRMTVAIDTPPHAITSGWAALTQDLGERYGALR